jgi:hypothetical protein
MIKPYILFISIILLFSNFCISQSFHGKFVFCDTTKFLDTGKRMVLLKTIYFDSTMYIIKSHNHNFGERGTINQKSIIVNGEYYLIDSSNNSLTHYIKGQPKKYNLKQTKDTEIVCGIKCDKYFNKENNPSYKMSEELWITDKFGTKFYGGPASFFAEGYGIILKRSSQQTNFNGGTAKMVISNLIATSVSQEKINDAEFVLPDWPVKNVDVSKFVNNYLKQ